MLRYSQDWTEMTLPNAWVAIVAVVSSLHYQSLAFACFAVTFYCCYIEWLQNKLFFTGQLNLAAAKIFNFIECLQCLLALYWGIKMPSGTSKKLWSTWCCVKNLIILFPLDFNFVFEFNSSLVSIYVCNSSFALGFRFFLFSLLAISAYFLLFTYFSLSGLSWCWILEAYTWWVGGELLSIWNCDFVENCDLICHGWAICPEYGLLPVFLETVVYWVVCIWQQRILK